jgi:hypothetical protein
MSPSEIVPANLRLAQQSLNQLHHRVPQLKSLVACQWQTASCFLKTSVNYRKAVERQSAMAGQRHSLYQLSVMLEVSLQTKENNSIKKTAYK